MFGWKKLARRLEGEVTYLRSRIKELEDQNLAIMNRDAFWDTKTGKDYDNDVVLEPTATDPMGHVVAMDATTDEEKEQKKQAMSQMNQIMGAGTSGYG